MAKLVLGTDINNTGTASFVRDLSPEYYREYEIDSNGVFRSIKVNVDFSKIKSFAEAYALSRFYYGNKDVTEFNFKSLKTLDKNGVFNACCRDCTNLKTLNFDSLEIVQSDNNSQAFYGCKSIEYLNFPKLTKIFSTSTEYMFAGCTSLKTISFPKLKEMSGTSTRSRWFEGCTNLTTLEMPLLECDMCHQACIYAFNNCTKLTNVNLDSLVTLGINGPSFYCAFQNTGIQYNPMKNVTFMDTANALFYGSKMIDGTFPKLAYITNSSSWSNASIFGNCKSLEKLDFPSLRRINSTAIKDIVNGSNNVKFTDMRFPCLTIFSSNQPFADAAFRTTTNSSHSITVHFRKDMQSKIETLTNYSTGWGAGAIVFDQIGTITVNGELYKREGSCNKEGYIAWQKLGSTITVDNKIYNYDDPSIGYYSIPNRDVPKYYGALYYWKCSDDNSQIRTPNLDLKVGDLVLKESTSERIADLEVTDVSNNIFVYTADNKEPEIGDTVYSDLGTTSIGIVSAIA